MVILLRLVYRLVMLTIVIDKHYKQILFILYVI